jgi:hypothetical protein
MPVEKFQCIPENEARLLELRQCAENQQKNSYKEYEGYVEDKKKYDEEQFAKRMILFEDYIKDQAPEEKELLKKQYKRFFLKKREKYRKKFEEFEEHANQIKPDPEPSFKAPDFVLHPWNDKCDENDFIFVSYKRAEISETCHDFIQGWMHVHIRDFTSSYRDETNRLIRFTLKIAHLSYISTNQNKSKVGPGIGAEMMDVMEKSMLGEECNFIELMPLPRVVGFYEKLKYKLEFEQVNYYTKWLQGDKVKKELDVYEETLNKEQEKIDFEMQKQEDEAIGLILENLSTEEQEKYEELQEEDGSLRMDLYFAYEDAKQQYLDEHPETEDEEAEEIAIQEVKNKLFFQSIFNDLTKEEREEFEDSQEEDVSTITRLISTYKEAEELEEGTGVVEVKKMLH